MKLLYILVLTMIVLCTNVSAKDIIYGNFNNVKYLYNYDGDTVTFDIKGVHRIIGEKISIRIYGIDTPEMRGTCFNEKVWAFRAKYYVSDVLSNSKKIRLKNVRRGKYFRIVAEIITDQGDLAKLLLDKGLAVEYDGGTKSKDWCLDEH